MSTLSQFIKQKRKAENLTQEELSLKAGVGLRFIRDIEQGKETLRMDKVNLVLSLFGHELTPTKTENNETR
jgi:y4mF family transcriptional regulator